MHGEAGSARIRQCSPHKRGPWTFLSPCKKHGRYYCNFSNCVQCIINRTNKFVSSKFVEFQDPMDGVQFIYKTVQIVVKIRSYSENLENILEVSK
jgi:hypothetical protein